ncbi:MAG: dihydroorotate dehydrogenase electron transfer subunit [Lachnospiraceae bacterium]|nr:dihydroorotate dehydrogenase electron transfer subunit [Lachnospiraceae bacterium]
MAKEKQTAVVVKQEKLTEGVYSLVIKAPMAGQARPGQFVAVFPKDKSHLLGRPISICDADPAAETLRLVYRVAGNGTAEFSALQSGNTVDVLGILGNGYDLSIFAGKKVIVIGGGIGIPPMLMTAKQFAGEKVAVLGYNGGDLFLKEEFDKECTTYVATMDGSAGTKGTVIDAIKAEGITGDVILACGPMPMLRAVKEYAKGNGMMAFISLEERMACGVGACLGCVTKTTEVHHHTNVENARICLDGPVFNAEDVNI